MASKCSGKITVFLSFALWPDIFGGRKILLFVIFWYRVPSSRALDGVQWSWVPDQVMVVMVLNTREMEPPDKVHVNPLKPISFSRTFDENSTILRNREMRAH